MRPIITMNTASRVINCEDIFYSVNVLNRKVSIQRISTIRWGNDNKVQMRVRADIDPYYEDQSTLKVEMYYYAQGWKELFSDTPTKESYEVCNTKISSTKDDIKELFDYDCNKLFEMITNII